MKKVLIQYNNQEVEAILLAHFKMADNELAEKKGLFGLLKRSVTPIERKYCVVFLPWKHAEKELALVPASDVKSAVEITGDDVVNVSEYISRFSQESPYYTEYKVSDFVGYKFIFDNKNFIADIKNQCTAKPIEVLYQNYPELLQE